MISIILDKYTDVLCHTIDLLLRYFEKLHTVFHIAFIILHSHQQCSRKGSYFSHILINTCSFLGFCVALFFITSVPTGVRWYLTMVLISLMMLSIFSRDTHWMFIHLLWTKIWVLCPFFSIRLVGFLLLSCRNSSYILDINPLYQIHGFQTFSLVFFPLWWLSPLPCRNCLAWCSSMCLFCLSCLCFFFFNWNFCLAHFDSSPSVMASIFYKHFQDWIQMIWIILLCFPHKLLDLIGCKYTIGNLSFDPSNQYPSSKEISLRRQSVMLFEGQKVSQVLKEKSSKSCRNLIFPPKAEADD